jgi:hypothetical protein
MSDPSELAALKASLRGAVAAAQALAPVADRLEQLPPGSDVLPADLDELTRLSLANAIAAQALRGLVETMLVRRGEAAG